MPDPRDRVIEAARQVALNAYGTNPRHTRARDGGCRDDCIPCGIAELEAALVALDLEPGDVWEAAELLTGQMPPPAVDPALLIDGFFVIDGELRPADTVTCRKRK